MSSTNSINMKQDIIEDFKSDWSKNSQFTFRKSVF